MAWVVGGWPFKRSFYYENETSTTADAGRCPRRLRPYALAVKETYEVATDPRSVVTQATDTQAEAQIKAALLASPVSGTSGIDVYCRQESWCSWAWCHRAHKRVRRR